MHEPRLVHGDRSTTSRGGLALSVVVPVYNERRLVGELLRRLLALSIPGISKLEILVVDDGSTDGSAEIVTALAAGHPGRLRLLRQPENRGKGAALRAGVAQSTGDLIVFQDADLEYDPRELVKLVRPFRERGADVVYGSRFSGGRRGASPLPQALGNRLLTWASNLATGLDLSDVETCYKMFRAPLLKSIPIRSDDFGVEVELTAKVAKLRSRIFEVPIGYRPRTYREGKKITWRDGVKALSTILRFWLADDLQCEVRPGGPAPDGRARTRRIDRVMPPEPASRPAR